MKWPSDNCCSRLRNVVILWPSFNPITHLFFPFRIWGQWSVCIHPEFLPKPTDTNLPPSLPLFLPHFKFGSNMGISILTCIGTGRLVGLHCILCRVDNSRSSPWGKGTLALKRCCTETVINNVEPFSGLQKPGNEWMWRETTFWKYAPIPWFTHVHQHYIRRGSLQISWWAHRSLSLLFSHVRFLSPVLNIENGLIGSCAKTPCTFSL